MKFIYSLLLLIFSFSVFSQTNHVNKCGHDEWLDAIEKTAPGYKQQIKDSFKAFNKKKI